MAWDNLGFGGKKFTTAGQPAADDTTLWQDAANGAGSAASAIGGGLKDLLGMAKGQSNFSATPQSASDFATGNGVGAQLWQQNQEARGPLAGTLSQLQRWAMTGEGPSQAQGLLSRANQQNMSDAASMAKSMPGGNLASAQRAASDAMAAGNANASRDAATLRAQEQQQAMQGYLQGQQALRGQDLATLAALYGTETAARTGAQSANANVASGNAQRGQGFVGNVANFIGGLGESFGSDERIKKNKRPVRDDAGLARELDRMGVR